MNTILIIPFDKFTSAMCPFCGFFDKLNDTHDFNKFVKVDVEYTLTVPTIFCNVCGGYGVFCPTYVTINENKDDITLSNKCVRIMNNHTPLNIDDNAKKFIQLRLNNNAHAQIFLVKMSRIVGFCNMILYNFSLTNDATQLEIYRIINNFFREYKNIDECIDDDNTSVSKRKISKKIEQFGLKLRTSTDKFFNCPNCKHDIVDISTKDIGFKLVNRNRKLHNLKFLTLTIDNYNLFADMKCFPNNLDIGLDNQYILVCQDTDGHNFKMVQWGD